MNTEPEELTEGFVGFLGFYPAKGEGALLGAAMVTDLKGYPLEFRVSTPVRPSAVQRALYGDSLEAYVVAELIGQRLLSDIQRKPPIVLVNRLNGIEVNSSYPIAFIAHAGDFVRTEGDGLHHLRLERASTGGGAMEMASSSGHAQALDDAVEQLGIASRRFDLVDVFVRMEAALNVLVESDERYR